MNEQFNWYKKQLVYTKYTCTTLTRVQAGNYLIVIVCLHARRITRNIQSESILFDS